MTRTDSQANAATMRLLTIKEVAGLCQVSTRTVRRWIDESDLTVHRLGRQIRVSEQDFATFVKTRRD